MQGRSQSWKYFSQMSTWVTLREKEVASTDKNSFPVKETHQNKIHTEV